MKIVSFKNNYSNDTLKQIKIHLSKLILSIKLFQTLKFENTFSNKKHHNELNSVFNSII